MGAFSVRIFALLIDFGGGGNAGGGAGQPPSQETAGGRRQEMAEGNKSIFFATDGLKGLKGLRSIKYCQTNETRREISSDQFKTNWKHTKEKTNKSLSKKPLTRDCLDINFLAWANG